MNENLNLCEILKNYKGHDFYTTIYGNAKLKEVRKNDLIFESVNGIIFLLSSKGKYGLAPDGVYCECVVFPSADQRDWNKFIISQRNIHIEGNSPMMVSPDKINWSLRYYSRKDSQGTHHVYNSGYKYEDKVYDSYWKYMIPYEKFDVNDIEGSLLYDVQMIKY